MKEFSPIVEGKTQYIEPTAFQTIGHTEVRWLGGTGFMLNSRGTILMIDPLLITNQGTPLICEEGLEMVIDYPIRAGDVPCLDVLLYTHSDDDHLGRETAVTLAKLKPAIIAPPPAFVRLTRAGVDPNIVEMCRYGDKFSFGPMEIEVMKADHPWQLQNPAKYGKPFRIGDAVGYKITTPDGVLLFPGDTRLMEEHLSITGIDVLAVDVSRCEYHINVRGATTLANLLKDALLIPYHYGTYNAPDIPAHCGDPEDVFCNVTEREKREKRLAPGQALRILEGKSI